MFAMLGYPWAVLNSPGLLMDKNGQDEVGRREPHSVTDAGNVVHSYVSLPDRIYYHHVLSTVI